MAQKHNSRQEEAHRAGAQIGRARGLSVVGCIGPADRPSGGSAQHLGVGMHICGTRQTDGQAATHMGFRHESAVHGEAVSHASQGWTSCGRVYRQTRAGDGSAEANPSPVVASGAVHGPPKQLRVLRVPTTTAKHHGTDSDRDDYEL